MYVCMYINVNIIHNESQFEVRFARDRRARLVTAAESMSPARWREPALHAHLRDKCNLVFAHAQAEGWGR